MDDCLCGFSNTTAGICLGHLKKLIHLSFESGHFLSILKTATIVPIFQKDDPRLASNYRPISILLMFSKVFENIFYDKLLELLKSRNIQYLVQFGLRKKMATIDAIVLMDDVDGLKSQNML